MTPHSPPADHPNTINAPPSRAPKASSSTIDRKIARTFGLDGEKVDQAREPGKRVRTRFTTLSLLSLAIWSRDWIGIWCLIPMALAIAWMLVNPVFFKAPRSTRNWASRSVLGERIWVDRDKVELPEQFRSRAASLVANAYSGIGIGLLAYGLVELNLLATATGIIITHGGKAWYLDRVGLLFWEMKDRNPEYAAWDY